MAAKIPEEQINEMPQSNVDHGAAQALNVLMIEDDQYYFAFLRRLLTRCSDPTFNLKNVASLREAARVLSAAAPDVILLDLCLPDSKGLGTLMEVRELAGGVPIIVLTGSDDEQTGLKAVALGAQDFLVKHVIGNDTVIRCIRYAIERRKFEESTLRQAAIGDFSATLAHDLRVPMIGSDRVFQALISGQFGDLSPEQVRVIAELQRSNEKQLAMVGKLLEVYRYEGGAPALEFKHLYLKPLILECVKNLSQSSPPPIPIVTFLPDNLPPVEGDEEALRRLFINILDNAIKFSNGAGEIRIHTELIEGTLMVHVYNSGSAIPPEVQSGRFQKFWQGVPGKHYVARTGLGLYLCQRIASLHRGKITCYSTLEEGTTIKVALPICKP